MNIVPKVTLAVTILSFLLASPIHSQVIRSYEGLDRNAADGSYALIDISLDARTGNSKYLDLRFLSGYSYRVPTPGHWIRFYPSVRIRRSETETSLRELSGHLRHSYVYSDVLRSFAFAQLQADHTIELDRRLLVGGGIRRQIVPLKDGGLDIGIGLMIEDEILASGETWTALRGANLLSIHGGAGNAQLTATGFFQPVISQFGDHRMAVSMEIRIPVIDGLRFVISANWRRDSRPPPGINGNDAVLGFSAQFSTG